MEYYNGVAKASIYKQTPYQRALGRMVSIPRYLAESEPSGDMEADLAADSFWTYFSQEPQVQELPERDLNRRLLDWVQGSASWERTKAKTSGRLLASATAAGILQSQLLTDPEVKKLIEEQKKAEQARAEAEQAEREAEALERAAQESAKAGQDEQAEALSQAAGQAKAKADQANQAAAQAAQAVADGMDKMTGDQGAIARRANALKQASEQAEKAEAFMSAWGSDPGQMRVDDLEPARKLIDQYGDALEQITRLMGRIEGIAMSKKSQKPAPSQVVVSDGYTQKLPHVFPGELALLGANAPDILRAAKMGEYADHGLEGMVEGSDAKEEGGIVFLVDGSSSMDDDGRQVKATALALGMAQAAGKSNQPYKLIRFSSASDPLYEVDSEQGSAELMRWATRVQSGGTDFNKPLTAAMDYIETLDERADQTDIVFITDGEAAVSQAVMARLNTFIIEHHTRVMYLAVGEQGRKNPLRDASAAQVFLGDGMRAEKAAEALAAFLWDANRKTED